MNVVDSSGWLEYFGMEPNNEFFAPAIQAVDQLVVPTITLYEVFKKVLRERGEEEALNAVGWMTLGLVVNLTQEVALAAAELSNRLQLPMADSIILATAQLNEAVLWTQDEHFKNLPEVKYIQKKQKNS